MYGKAFESMYDGSMVGAGLNVFAVWNWIIAKRRGGHIEINPKLLAFTLGGRDQDVKVIEDAIEFLMSPDEQSRSKLEGGRRLLKQGQFQYHVVNWEYYDRIKSDLDRREYNRVMQSEWRARQNEKKISKMKSTELPGEAAEMAELRRRAREEDREADRKLAADAGLEYPESDQDCPM